MSHDIPEPKYVPKAELDGLPVLLTGLVGRISVDSVGTLELTGYMRQETIDALVKNAVVVILDLEDPNTNRLIGRFEGMLTARGRHRWVFVT